MNLNICKIIFILVISFSIIFDRSNKPQIDIDLHTFIKTMRSQMNEQMYIMSENPEEETEETETEEIEYESKEVPVSSSFKSYMSYEAITNKDSPQYELQQQAETNEYGIRVVDGKLCIALGSYFTTDIGTEIDIVMENGAVIKCILADAKADQHTDSNNIKAKDGSVVEFIVDTSALHDDAKYHGDISYIGDEFSGEIVEVKVYKDENKDEESEEE